MRIIGTLDRDRAAVRVEDTFTTGIDDLWDACTSPERLTRRIAAALDGRGRCDIAARWAELIDGHGATAGS